VADDLALHITHSFSASYSAQSSVRLRPDEIPRFGGTESWFDKSILQQTRLCAAAQQIRAACADSIAIHVRHRFNPALSMNGW
jgi:hypothetical protein